MIKIDKIAEPPRINPKYVMPSESHVFSPKSHKKQTLNKQAKQLDVPKKNPSNESNKSNAISSLSDLKISHSASTDNFRK